MTLSLGSDTVAALESAWADIHARYPDVIPNVVFITGSGRQGRKGLKLGHVTVAPNWQSRDAGSSQFHEVFIAAETLAQHPVKLLETLIHEAAHTVAMTRGVKDVSRQNRYHNRRFRTICEEMGLAWEHLAYRVVKGDDGLRNVVDHPDFDPGIPEAIHTNPRWQTCEAKADDVIGYSDMTITEDTARLFGDTVANLDKNVSVQGAPLELSRSGSRRRMVCMMPHHTMREVSSFKDAVHVLGKTPSSSEFQRIGMQVYEGLKGRDLLAPHLFWIAEV